MDKLDFKTSVLGSKKYWDDFYSLEHKNYAENPEDTGECWFDESNAEDKMCEYILETLSTERDLSHANVCDLGTGNGHLLFQLLEEGLNGCNLIGVDYSEVSIKFASDIAKERELDVKFEQSDLLKSADHFLSSHNEPITTKYTKSN